MVYTISCRLQPKTKFIQVHLFATIQNEVHFQSKQFKKTVHRLVSVGTQHLLS